MSISEMNNLNFVKVYARERPTTQAECEPKRQNVVQEISNNEIVVKTGTTTKKYNFNRVFDKNTSQEEIYNVVVAPLINFVLSGYTCTVFAYGQTGTGKTYTMIGKDGVDHGYINDCSNGIIPRASVDLYAELKKCNMNFTMSVSFIEIYNEEVRDLLVKNGSPLKVYDDQDNKGATCIKGVIEKPVETVEEIFEQLRTGTVERHTTQTNLNRLSHSHTIFTIVVKTCVVTNQEEIITTGKLCMVDLAGSENIWKSGATKMKAWEAASINKSLLALGKVIKALAMKMPYVPYRESNLTRILQDSLGGKSKTRMIVTFTPCIDFHDETLTTLEYAQEARNVANYPIVNINRQPSNALEESEKEFSLLRQELDAVMSGEGFCMLESTYDKLNFDIQSKYERILTLNQEIKRMQEYITEQQELVNDSNVLYKDSNFELEKLKKQLLEARNKLQEDVFLRIIIRGKIDALLQSEKKLRELCDTLIKHEDIYYKKYELQCVSTLNNADIAKNIYLLSKIFLHELKTFSDQFHNFQTTRLEDLRPIFHEIEGIRINNAEEFEKIDSEMRSKTEFWNLNYDIFKNTPYKDFVEHENLLENSIQARIKNAVVTRETVDNVKEVVIDVTSDIGAKMAELGRLIDIEIARSTEIVANLSENKRKLCESFENKRSLNEKQLLANRKMQDLQSKLIEEMIADAEETERELELIRREKENIELDNIMSDKELKTCATIQEILNTWRIALESTSELVPIIKESNNFIHNTTMACQQELDSYQSQTLEYFNGLTDAFDAKVSENDEDFKNTGKNWVTQLDVIKENLKNMDEEHLKCLDSQLESILSNMKIFEDELKHFNKTSTQDLEKFSKEVTHQVHAGDTPVKVVHKFPRELPKLKSMEELRAQCGKLYTPDAEVL